jgi:hypothetical protein
MCRALEERGPQIAPEEELFRIVSAEHVKGGVVSTGAFNYKDCFSVEVVSRTAGPADSLSRVPRACAVIRFNCGCARTVGGLDTRDERDDTHPANLAHAHVYPTGGSARRKTLAKAFVIQCRPEIVLNNCLSAGD